MQALTIYNHNIYIYQHLDMAEKQKRPEFINGVRVRMPEDYTFNTWGTVLSNGRQRLVII